MLHGLLDAVEAGGVDASDAGRGAAGSPDRGARRWRSTCEWPLTNRLRCESLILCSAVDDRGCGGGSSTRAEPGVESPWYPRRLLKSAEVVTLTSAGSSVTAVTSGPDGTVYVLDVDGANRLVAA